MLPIDRSAKAVIDANLVNGVLSDGPKLKANDDVLYNTIDELYNYTRDGMATLVSAGTLSRLGIVNVRDYNASGLATTAVGSITTGAKVLTLTTTPDFVAGHGINIQGAFEASSLQVTAAATVSSNVTVTLNGVAFTVAVLAGDTAIQVATKIRAATYAGWTAGGTAGTDTVTFTSATSGVKTDAIYSAGTTTSTGVMTTTTQGTADQISTVSSVAGLVVNIADNATRTITAGAISHDETTALQTAINYVISIGKTEIVVPYGTYRYGVLTNSSGITFIGDGVTLIGTTALKLTSVATLRADNTSRAVNVKYPPSPLVAAVVDGVTDDTAAINGIVDYLDTLGGGILIFPEGITIVSSPIKLRSYITYQGVGWGSQIRQKPSVVAGNLFGEATPSGVYSGITIKNLYLNGNKAISIHPSDDVNGNLIRFNQIVYSRIENCYLENAKNNGISIYNGSNDNIIDNCQINDNGATSGLPTFYSLNGIFIEFGSNRNKIINSRISSNGQKGVWIGVRDADNSDNVIENNYIGGNGAEGILIGDNTGIATSRRTKILNNSILGNLGVGIRLNHGGTGVMAETIISQNTVASNGGGGIYIQAGPTKTIVTNNVCISNTGYGLVSSGSATDTVFATNIALSNTVDQVLFTGTRTVEIANILNASGVINSSSVIQSENALKVSKASGSNADMILAQAGVVDWTMRNVATTGTLDLLFGSIQALRVQKTPNVGDVGLMVYRNVSGTLTLEQISMGTADSGGAGFKLLRVSN